MRLQSSIVVKQDFRWKWVWSFIVEALWFYFMWGLCAQLAPCCFHCFGDIMQGVTRTGEEPVLRVFWHSLSEAGPVHFLFQTTYPSGTGANCILSSRCGFVHFYDSNEERPVHFVEGPFPARLNIRLQCGFMLSSRLRKIGMKFRNYSRTWRSWPILVAVIMP